MFEEKHIKICTLVAFCALHFPYLRLCQKNSGGTTLATVTVMTKDTVFIAKAGLDTLEGGAALKVVSVAFAN